MLPNVTTRAEAYALAGALTLAVMVAAGLLSLGVIHLAVPQGHAALRDTATTLAALIVVTLAAAVFAPFSLFVSLGLLRAHQFSEDIRMVAETDQLTGLPNRAATMARLKDAVARCAAKNQRGALLFVDLDHFKSINDTYGHAGGDCALVHAARVMRETMPKDMIVGRFGGEEFVCFGPNAAETVAYALAIVMALRATPARFGEASIRVTASVGLAMMGDAATLEALLENADRALYLAKSAGRNRLVHHEDFAQPEPTPAREEQRRKHRAA